MLRPHWHTGEVMKIKTYHDYLAISIIITIAIICICIALFLMGAFKIPGCIFYTKFNIYCPACGATRAFIHLLDGNIIESVISNPMVFYFIAVVISYLVLYVYIKLRNKPEAIITKYCKVSFYIGIFLILGNFIIRNILLHVYNIHIT